MPLSEDALLLGVDDDALAQVVVGGHELVAVLVDGEPVEGGVHRLQDEAALALARGRIGGLVGVLGVGVEAAGAALQGVARLDVHAAAARAAGTRASGHALPAPGPRRASCWTLRRRTAGSCCRRCSRNARLLRRGHAAARRAAQGAGVVASPGLTPMTETSARSPPLVAGSMVTLAVIGAGGRLFPVLAVGLRLDAVVDQRRDVAVALEDGHLDDAVVEGPTVAVVGEGDRIVDRDFGDLRQHMGGRLLRRCAGSSRTTARARNMDTKRSLAFVIAQPFRTNRRGGWADGDWNLRTIAGAPVFRQRKEPGPWNA